MTRSNINNYLLKISETKINGNIVYIYRNKKYWKVLRAVLLFYKFLL